MQTDPNPSHSHDDHEAALFDERGVWLTRAFFVRSLGAVYCCAFISLLAQLDPLFGGHGILPVAAYVDEAKRVGMTVLNLPTLFWSDSSDFALHTAAWLGMAGAAALVAGAANALLCALLWLCYLSFVNVGQIFYGYGWESLLLECGFMAIFLAPPGKPGEFRQSATPPKVMLLFCRWTLFRLMFGAGLIKLRGDDCWRSLTCLFYHYETQPIPSPLSWYFHHLPPVFLTLGVLFNHFVELLVPWGFFLPRTWRATAGVITIVFQVLLLLSGNLSWLNYLTIVLCIACFDDGQLASAAPRRWLRQLEGVQPRRAGSLRNGVIFAVSALICALSINPALNMVSDRQLMNASFNQFHLVNTYGAFGSVGKFRYEIVLEGTNDVDLNEHTEWREYEFKCKPGSVTRRPCFISPFQLRLDWQIWFAAMSSFENNPWFIHLVAKLLEGDEEVLRLLGNQPFPEAHPHYVRALLYRYEFSQKEASDWWKRVFVRVYMPPLQLNDSRLQTYLNMQGWK